MTYHVGMAWSTYDVNNDLSLETSDSCAVYSHGALWYRDCHYANLNGWYGNTSSGLGINWYQWQGYTYSLKFAQMMMRPVD